MSEPPVSTHPRAKRIVQWGVLLLALWNLGRAAALYWQTDWVDHLESSPDPHLRMVLAGVWACLFVVATIVLRRGSYRVWRWIPLLIAIFGVYELGMMIAFATEPPAPFLAFAYTAFFCFSGWALWWPHHGGLSHSRQREDR